MDYNEIHQAEAARVMQVCFENKSPSKTQRNAAMTAFNSRSQNRNATTSYDNTISKIKTESESRAARIEEKIKSKEGENLIQRQPKQLLHSIGAYRNLRKSLKGDGRNAEAMKATTQDQYLNDSSVLQESPEKSFMSALVRKSANRSRVNNHVNTFSDSQPPRKNAQSSSIASKMLRITKSRSKSKAGVDSNGSLEHQIKELEINVTQVIAQKQTALQNNLAKFKEKMAQKRQENEQRIMDISHNQVQRSMIVGRTENSPFATRSPNRKSQGRTNPKQAVFSPPSFKNEQHVLLESRASFGDPANFHNESSIIEPNPVVDYRDQTYGPDQTLLQVTNMMNIPIPQHQFNLSSKLQVVQQHITQIFSLVTQGSNTQYREVLLPQNQVEELRNKLLGTFDRLAQLENEEEISDSIIYVFRNLMNDIALKLETYLDQEQLTSQLSIKSNLVKNIVQYLTLQLSQYDMVDTLPELAKSLHDLRISLAIQKLQSLHNQKGSYGTLKFFKSLQSTAFNKNRVTETLKKILKTYADKFEKMSSKHYFMKWKHRQNKHYQKKVKKIEEKLCAFQENVLKQATNANFNNFKGLPIFQELLQDLVIQCLKLTNDHQIIIEVIFLCKGQNKACQFVIDCSATGTNELTFNQLNLDLNARSVLKQLVEDYFVPGKKLDIIEVQGLQMHTKFNPSIDIPNQVGNLYKSQELHQLLLPILSESKEHIKLIIRFTSPSKQIFSASFKKQTQFVSDYISKPVLKNLSQFKKLCKQFTRFQDNIYLNDEKAFVSDCIMNQYQILNEACMDLACTLNTSQIINLVQKSVQALLSQFTKVSIVLFDQNQNVQRLVDNSQAYETFLNRMTDSQVSQREILQTPPLVMFTDIQNQALKQKMVEMGQLCLEQTCPLWIQILLEVSDSNEASGKSIRDIVLIPINQANRRFNNSAEHIVYDNNSIDTSNNLTSYAFDSVTHRSAFLNSSVCGNLANPDIYLLQLERKLQDISEQQPLDNIINIEQMLRALRQMVQIAVQKIKNAISVEKENKKQANAAACVAKLNKFQQLNSARVREQVFKKWVSKLKIEKAEYEALRKHNFHTKFGGDISMMSDMINKDESTYVDEPENSFQMRRNIQQMIRAYNVCRLQRVFDQLVSKTLGCNKRGQRLLATSPSCGFHFRRLVLGQFLLSKFKKVTLNAFSKYKKQVRSYAFLVKRLKQLSRFAHNSTQKQAFETWSVFTKQAKNQDIINNLALLNQSKKSNILDGLCNLISQHAFNIFEPQLQIKDAMAPVFRTAEECFSSEAFKRMIEDVQQYIVETTCQYPFAEKDFEIEDMVFNFQLPEGHNVNLPEPSVLCAQFVISKKPYIEQNESTLMSDPAYGQVSFQAQNDFKDLSRTFHSLEQVISAKPYPNKMALSYQEDQTKPTKEIMSDIQSETVQYFNDFKFSIVDVDQDNLIKTVYQAQNGFVLRNINEDPLLEQSLQIRSIPIQTSIPKSLIIVPIMEQQQITGNLELYVTSRTQIDEPNTLESDEQTRYWIETFQSYAIALGLGMRSIQVQLINKLALTQMLICNELAVEMQSFYPGIKQPSFDHQSTQKRRFTEDIGELYALLRKAYRADSCNLIFVSNKYESEAITFDSLLESVTINYSNTLVQELLAHQSCNSLTLPSSLVTPNIFKQKGSPLTHSNVFGEQFQAIKLISVLRKHEVIAVIEIGWTQINQAQLVHDNVTYLAKKDEKMKTLVADTLENHFFKLCLLQSLIKQRVGYDILMQKKRAFFARWKRITFLEQLANSFFDPKDQNNRSLNETNCLFTGANVSPVMHGTNARKMNIESEAISRKSRLVQDMMLKSEISYHRAQLVPYKSQQREQSLVQQSMLNFKLSQQFQGVNRIQKYQHAKQMRRKQLKEAFVIWKHSLMAQRITESAFEQMLESHQKHSEQRFASACSILSRIDKAACQKRALECMINRAIESMQRERQQFEARQQHQHSTVMTEYKRISNKINEQNSSTALQKMTPHSRCFE